MTTRNEKVEPSLETHEKVRRRRRAHWRRQRHGPDGTLVKRIRIKAGYVMVWRLRNPNYELPLS